MLTPEDELICKGLNQVGQIELMFDQDHLPRLRELIDNIEGTKQHTAMRPIRHSSSWPQVPLVA